MRALTIGARGSRLARRQVEIVSEALRLAHPAIAIDVREIKTEGDRSSAPLSQIGGLGVFTKAIEDALLDKAIDVAVHSLKDLPTELTPGLTLAAIPARADVRDALVTADGRGLRDLPARARIGTGSGRRAVQLLELRGDVEPAEIRGNVETRVRKVDAGEYDGAVLAMAGLSRLGIEARAAQVFALDEMLPAVGQGALAVEVREGDRAIADIVRAIDDVRTRAAVDAERAYLRRLGGGCRLPVAAYAEVQGEELRLRGMIAGDAARIFRGEVRGHAAEAEALGARLADRLLADGAERFVDPAAARDRGTERP